MARRAYIPDDRVLLSDVARRVGMSFMGVKYPMQHDPYFPTVHRMGTSYLLDKAEAELWVARINSRPRPENVRNRASQVTIVAKHIDDLRDQVVALSAQVARLVEMQTLRLAA